MVNASVAPLSAGLAKATGEMKAFSATAGTHGEDISPSMP
jgi:hypothetical protein